MKKSKKIEKLKAENKILRECVDAMVGGEEEQTTRAESWKLTAENLAIVFANLLPEKTGCLAFRLYEHKRESESK